MSIVWTNIWSRVVCVGVGVGVRGGRERELTFRKMIFCCWNEKWFTNISSQVPPHYKSYAQTLLFPACRRGAGEGKRRSSRWIMQKTLIFSTNSRLEGISSFMYCVVFSLFPLFQTIEWPRVKILTLVWWLVLVLIGWVSRRSNECLANHWLIGRNYLVYTSEGRNWPPIDLPGIFCLRNLFSRATIETHAPSLGDGNSARVMEFV